MGQLIPCLILTINIWDYFLFDTKMLMVNFIFQLCVYYKLYYLLMYCTTVTHHHPHYHFKFHQSIFSLVISYKL